MKYSLRNLMIAVLLICVLLGGRIEYLRRWASHHDRESRRCATVERDMLEDAIQDARNAIRHQVFARRFTRALRRPWDMVDTRPMEIDSITVLELANRIVKKDIAGFPDDVFQTSDPLTSQAPATNPPKK